MSLKSKKPASKSKAIVGKSKHRSFRLTPKSFMLSLVVLTLATTTGVLGWNKVQYGSFTASAGGYTRIWANSTAHLEVHACRYSATGVRAKFTNRGQKTLTYQIGGSTTSVGAVSIKYLSVNIYGTTVYGGVWGWGGRNVSKYSIVNC